MALLAHDVRVDIKSALLAVVGSIELELLDSVYNLTFTGLTFSQGKPDYVSIFLTTNQIEDLYAKLGSVAGRSAPASECEQIPGQLSITELEVSS
jgi:hypothetical protein